MDVNTTLSVQSPSARAWARQTICHPSSSTVLQYLEADFYYGVMNYSHFDLSITGIRSGIKCSEEPPKGLKQITSTMGHSLHKPPGFVLVKPSMKKEFGSIQRRAWCGSGMVRKTNVI